ncbi:Polyamine-modulated factor 1 [Merluccius polli]|uniref:Polyamine-modulated factor 1 n=1 Tax=Merluccius polli TaxID=89951 RepID=A0AA47P7L1_MERPO|nr:Polyamine-modulated factor 1 [Merluccius polli]
MEVSNSAAGKQAGPPGLEQTGPPGLEQTGPPGLEQTGPPGLEQTSSRQREGGEPPEGRLKLFNKVLERSLKKFIEEASFQRFAKTFHPFYKRNPGVMENIHKQFIADLQRTIQEDISRLVEEGELQCKLDELDKLEKAAKNNKEPAWRPSGVPEEDLCSFVMPYYLKQEAYLKQELKKIQAENAALAQRVQAGREAIASTELRIAMAVDEWKESVKESQKMASSLHPADTPYDDDDDDYM